MTRGVRPKGVANRRKTEQTRAGRYSYVKGLGYVGRTATAWCYRCSHDHRWAEPCR